MFGMRTRLLVAAGVATAGVAAGGGYALAAAGGGGGSTVTLCSARHTHVLHSGHCAKNDTPIALQNGARAWGHVNGASLTGPSDNVSSVTNPTEGVYCITVAGATPAGEGLMAIIDYNGSTGGPGHMPSIEYTDGAPHCPTGAFEVDTYNLEVANGTLSELPERQAFFFAVP